MRKIRVRLKDRSYDIVIGRGMLRRLGLFVRKLGVGRDAIIITNRRIYNLYGNIARRSLKNSGITAHFEIVPDSEKSKSIVVMARLLERISVYDKKKNIFLIALGGGVIGDLTGFVAATYKRGVPYVQVPTTLLAQVDSAIGGKTAIDLPCAKNLAGAFYQPKMVLSDVSILGSLPEREIRNGLAEVIKYGVIKDRILFNFVERNKKRILSKDYAALEYIVARSSAIKRDIVEKDEFDKTGIRAVLNYGHTIGHAIESASSYSGKYNHGESVAIGMIAAANMAILSGTMNDVSQAARVRCLISACGLPTTAKGIKRRSVFASQLHDKKHTGKRNRFILPVKIGTVRVVENIPDSIIKRSINEVTER